MVQITLTNVSSQRIKTTLENLTFKMNTILTSNDFKLSSLEYKS